MNKGLARWGLNGVIIGGLVLACWPLGQSLYGQWSQRQLEAKWQAEQHQSKPSQAKTIHKAQKSAAKAQIARSTDDASPTLITANESNSQVKRHAKPWPLTKLSIPDINLETYVVQGWDDEALRRGPGHDPNSSPPGEGNCAIAGHRNVYGSFFYRIDELLPGSPIILENRDGRFTYTVSQTFTTTDTDNSILAPPTQGQDPKLTLITCTLPHTNSRVVLQASLDQR